ncbi:DUF2505 domain-containing protein [Isoalcanivorax indicus]|uniref:DUF2505 domain-containing protein n=1 Tax=Isoalcanivorax indicus TaxID=2202653 RepID=UPI0013C4BE77|nr:DUF2505 domain-containing protein [Isoalcanivorax indicus]
MSVNLDRSRSFPVSARTLYEVLASRDFYAARFAMSGVSDYGYEECRHDDGSLTIRFSRQLRTDTGRGKVPGFARRFIPGSAALQTEFVWLPAQTAPFRARFSVDVSGVPVSVSGDMQLLDVAGGCRQVLRAHIRSSVPLVGGKLCQLIADQVDRGLDKDSQATHRYLIEAGLVSEVGRGVR